jgi:hypothetical protein
MKAESANKNSGWKYFLIVLIVISAAVLAYFAVMNIMAPLHKLDSINKEFAIKLPEKNKPDERIYSDSTFLKLLKEKSFLQSRIAMAETDSIYLSVNIPDSVINLEINGVIVHITRIEKISISRILREGNEYIISSMLGKPFSIEKSYSTIFREPLMIKMAPKDTSEYQPDVIPDTARYEPVNYILEMSNGSRVFVYQYELSHTGDKMNMLKFDVRYRLRDLLESIKSVAAFKVPEYHPYIKIRIPRKDARIIYRALPVHGQIAVYR